MDSFSTLRHKLHEIAQGRGDWAGIPMPLENERLVVEPRYPNAQALMSIGHHNESEDPASGGLTVRNRFWSSHKRSDVVIYEHQDGRIDWGILPGVHHLSFDIRVLGCSEAWGIEQESRALELLGTLLEHRAFKQYLMTGSFLETSRRSGLAYLFRRLKPTVVISADPARNHTRIHCALCLHPIAYYEGSWAGAMCPTDDVVAHLMLMRGDERRFWAKASQHPAWRPEAGL